MSAELVAMGESPSDIKVVGRTDGAVRPIAVPEGVTKILFFQVVSAFDVAFRQGGTKPTIEEVSKLLPQVPKKRLKAVAASEEFATAMSARGIGFVAEDGLSPQQAAVLNVLENFSDTRALTSKLKDAGVSRPQFNAWLKDPIFYRFYESRIENHLRTAHLTALGTIISNAENGDQRAAEKVLEIGGRYNPQAVELQSARAVVSSMVEAIQRHVKDPEVVKAIIADVSLAQQVARIEQ